MPKKQEEASFMSEGYEEHPFYGFDILRKRQEDLIRTLLSKFKGRNADEALQKDIWDELQTAKKDGKVTIPFKVVLRRDAYRRYPTYVEVILDTKV
jgi:hypothetical protein